MVENFTTILNENGVTINVVTQTQNNKDSVNIKGFGAVADGITDNTKAINDAIDYAIQNGINIIYKPYGIYKIINMPIVQHPIRFEGDGIFIDSENRTFSFLDNYNAPIFGMEYLYKYHSELANKRDGNGVKIVFSGDSTISSGQFVNYARDFYIQSGFANATVVNAGHSGGCTSEWVFNEWLKQDIELNPTLYVLRWGLNDTSDDYSLAKVRTFENNLRNGLEQIRSSKSLEQMSILLLTPNACGISYKDKRWGIQINSIIRKAARDYKCCFADLFMHAEDVNVETWTSDNIHPQPTADRWFVDFISDILIPNTLRKQLHINPNSLMFASSTTPYMLPMGISLNRATISNGFPNEGLVESVYYYNICKQTLTTFDGSGVVKIRTWNVFNSKWNDWKII